jgi:ketosteroid isomerase-like protein
MTEYKKAYQPEDVTRLFVEFANAKDVDGLTSLYEPDAVMGFPPCEQTVGRDAIRAVLAEMVVHAPGFTQEEPSPTLRLGDLALTSTPSADGHGTRVQVVRRQADGSWQRIIDRPEAPGQD